MVVKTRKLFQYYSMNMYVRFADQKRLIYELIMFHFLDHGSFLKHSRANIELIEFGHTKHMNIKTCI